MASSIGKFSASEVASLIKIAADQLKPLGDAYTQPILQQMGVDTNDDVPNLIFVPNDEVDKKTKRVFVVEFKQTDTQVLPDIFVANADQHQRTLQDANEKNNLIIEYGLASNGEVVTGRGRETKVTPIASITTADELVETIKKWASSQVSKE